MKQGTPAWNISRRTTLAGLLGSTAAAALTGCTQVDMDGEPGAPIEGQPNFLFIMADDLGYADLSCYGRREYKTPALDKLAADGMKFMHGYANSAVCSATRMGLITGRYQNRLRGGLEEPLGRPDMGLPADHPTLPSLLRDQGYHTALIGKWHLGNLPDFGPLKSGYDEFWGNRGGGVDYFTQSIAGTRDLWDGEVQIDDVGYYTDMLADRSIEFLEARSAEDKPWLLSLHFTAPHWPWEGNNDKGRSESEYLASKEVTGELDIVHYDGGDMQTYADMVTSLDANIGRVLEKLVETGMDKNTVVVFTSDNGGERFSDTWPFTGKKTELLEGGMRVPFIVKWPGVAAPGSTNDSPVLSMDFLPTFVAAAGGAPAPDYPSDGIDFTPALRGETLPERTLFWRFFNKDQKAARRGQYKYLSINGVEFLFDVVADPLERGNLKDRLPEKFAELKAAWAQWDSQMVHANDVSSYGFTADMLADHFGWDN